MSMKNYLLRHEKSSTLPFSKRSKFLQNFEKSFSRSNQFVCRICLKTFKENAQLTMHKRLHTASKDSSSPITQMHRDKTKTKIENCKDIYVCDLCEKTFNDEIRLKKHIDKKHQSSNKEQIDLNNHTDSKTNTVEHDSMDASDIGNIDIESRNQSENNIKMNDKPPENVLIKNDDGSESDGFSHDDFIDDQFDSHEDENYKVNKIIL